MDNICNKLRLMRYALRLRIRDVSTQTGIPRSTISDLENMRHESSYKTVKILEEFYTKLMQKRNLDEIKIL